MATRAASGGPSRRTVLLTALVTFAGVAGARVIGVRDLGTAAVRRVTEGAPLAVEPMDESVDMGMGMDAPMDMAGSEIIPPEPMAEPLPAQAMPTGGPAPTTAARTQAPAAPTPRSAAAPAAALPMPALAPPKISGYDWVSPLDAEAARIGHLLRRATFGATDAELDQARSDGYARTVDRLIETPPATPPAAPGDNGTSTTRIDVGALQTWWVDWMLRSPTPFAEKMTLFWHGHFTSDYRKAQSTPMYWQNQTWRSFSLGKLGDMLHRVTIDQAMLRYLDLATSTGRNPNENYARELMELFTMGVDTFTEDDVKAASKALAGWRLPRATESVRTGVFDPARAYVGQLTFLGKTGTFDTTAVIDRILAQDATATYLARQVVTHFVSPMVSAAYVARIAEAFRRSGYDTKALMWAIFQSPEFIAPEAYRALVKGPVEFMVSTAKAIGSQALARAIVASGSALGQSLFDPPNVGGWGDHGAWVSSNTMLGRANFVTTALGATRTLPPAANAATRHLDGIVGPETAKELTLVTTDRQRWFAILVSPEFQLK
jgi:uncharacterized protein (DUF1800 family)